MTPAQERKLDDVATEVRDIKSALVGSEANGNEGLVKEVYRNKKKIEDLQAIKNQGKGAFWIIGIGWVLLECILHFTHA